MRLNISATSGTCNRCVCAISCCVGNRQRCRLMRFLRYHELRAKGVPWSLTHIYRLEAKGAFPCHIKLGTKTNVWREPEIDQFMADRLAQREAPLPELATIE